MLLALLAGAVLAAAQTGQPAPSGAPRPTPGAARAFVSRPDIVPAPWNVTYRSPHVSPAPGYVFLSPVGTNPLGIQIFTNDGTLIYANNSGPALGANNFQPQTLNAEHVLNFWQGPVHSGHSLAGGTNYILNSDYTLNRTVHPAHTNDLHEFAITKNNTALATYYTLVHDQDLRAAHGPARAPVIDGCFRELDLRSNRTLFDYCPRHNVSYALSYLPTNGSAPWDWFHINAVAKDDLGNYLISSRHLHTLFYIDGHSREVLWRLGGKNSSFSGNGTHFAWQHFARWLDDNSSADLVRRNRNGTRTLSLFDNGSNGRFHDAPHSSGQIIELDFAQMTATLLRKFWRLGNTSALADSQGSFSVLPHSGHTFAGFGAQPIFAEFASDTRPVQVVHFGGRGEQSYRVFKAPWRGTPQTAPDAVIRGSALYVSWNGATDVHRWAVLQHSAHGRNVTHAHKTGFETRIPIASARSTHVDALDIHGNVLATSDKVHPCRSIRETKNS